MISAPSYKIYFVIELVLSITLNQLASCLVSINIKFPGPTVTSLRYLQISRGLISQLLGENTLVIDKIKYFFY